MTQRPKQTTASTTPNSHGEQIAALRWHLERYDRLRVSTASRAAIVLSAGAILSAGNAVVLSQVLNGSFDRYNRWLVLLFSAGVLVGAGLVILSIVRAANVLVTLRPSHDLFGDDRGLPPALLYNGSYTVTVAHTFEAFRTEVAAQTDAERVEAAQVELYVDIRQHRHRYAQLRAAVRSLRWAATVFLVLLGVGVVMKLVADFTG